MAAVHPTKNELRSKAGEVVIDVGDHTVEVRDGNAVFRKDKVQIARAQGTLLEVTLDRGTAVAQGDKKGKNDDDGPVGEIANIGGLGNADSVKFSPTTLFALTSGEPLQIFDLQKRKQVKSWGGGHCAVFTPDGRTVVCSQPVGYQIGFYDPMTGTYTARLNSPKFTSYDLSYSPNGKMFLAPSWADGFVRVWSFPALKEYREFKHSTSSNSACFTPDNKYVLSGGNDRLVRLWDIEADRQEKTYEGHESPIRLVRTFADGKRIVSVSHDGKAIVWDLKSGKQLLTFSLENVPALGDFSAQGLAVASEGHRLLAGHTDGSISIWDLNKGEKLIKLTGHKGFIKAVDITPDGRYALSAGNDATLRYWRLPPVAPGNNKRLEIPVEKKEK